MQQVSHTTLGASKNVKFRLSWNSTKFDVTARFRETIPTVKSVSLSEIYKKIPNFLPKLLFYPFSKIRIFRGFTLHKFVTSSILLAPTTGLAHVTLRSLERSKTSTPSQGRTYHMPFFFFFHITYHSVKLFILYHSLMIIG